MTIKLIKIGSSRGVRLPKKLIEKFNFGDELEMEIKKDGLLLKKSANPRLGWYQNIQQELKNEDFTEDLIPGSFKNEFDESDWQW